MNLTRLLSMRRRSIIVARADCGSSTLHVRRIMLTAMGATLLLAAVSLFGCARYRFGAATLFPPDIQTVYVPVFESNSFRRGLSEWLTEAVCKEIEGKTPYKVVGTPNADSVLSGKLISDTKRVIIEDAFDFPREVEANIAVEVRWVNRRGDLINQTASVPLPQDLVLLSAPGTQVAEFGQSLSTAQLQSIKDLAAQIVSLMEMPW
jgi:lipopolysaccharide assembly LptE-like protein